jgi:hypothetical protein
MNRFEKLLPNVFPRALEGDGALRGLGVKSVTREMFRGVLESQCCSSNTDGCKMRSLAISAALLSGLGTLVFMGTVASSIPAAARCMIDEGNGRYTPCSALYQRGCLRDEGNGRFTSCSSFAKPKKTKKH